MALPKAEPHNVKSLKLWIMSDLRKSFNINGPGSKSWGDILERNIQPEKDPSIASLINQLLEALFSPFWPKKEERDNSNLVFPRCNQQTDSFVRWVGAVWIPFLENFLKWWRKHKENFLKWWRKCKAIFDIEKANLATTQPVSNMSQEPATEKPRPSLYTYSERRIVLLTSALATIVACSFPIVAITVLSQLHGTGKLLGTIASFTVAFATGLMLFGDNVRRVDVFTATAA